MQFFCCLDIFNYSIDGCSKSIPLTHLIWFFGIGDYELRLWISNETCGHTLRLDLMWAFGCDEKEAKRRPVQTSKSNSKCVPFVIMTEEPDTFYDSRFAAEINNRMRVPDRIMVAGENQTRSPTFVGINGPPSSFGRERVEQKVEMLVPDRILVAGGDRHIAAKSTPFEMQVENSVMPPSRHDVIIMPTYLLF